MVRKDVVVVGAGLAGLCCARQLVAAGFTCTVLDAADAPGGRVRTDEVDGFLCDRGFQVLLQAYPECRAVLDYDSLDLRPFYPGALVRVGRRFHRVADPWRRPIHAIGSVISPIGSLRDKLRVALLRGRLRRKTLDELFRGPERTTHEALEAEGFSPAMIDRFFRPFLGGVFLEPNLETSGRMFEFVFKMFSEGGTVLPAQGMESIPRALASDLPDGTLRLGARVDSLETGALTLAGGERIEAGSVVVATDSADASTLLPELGPPAPFHATTCLYFDAPEPPLADPILVLEGDDTGPINSLCVPSSVSPAYAPADRSLVSVTTKTRVAASPTLERDVREQMAEWFGAWAREWRLLATYRIPRALPARATLEPVQLPVEVRRGVLVCGDHREHPSIQGAMVSGRRAAESILSAASG